MNKNCIYCNSNVEKYSSVEIFVCQKCRCNYKFSNEGILLDTIWTSENKYNLIVNFKNNTTKLTTVNLGKSIIELDYIIDVNANNTDKIIKRLLNLKTFS